ncbi:MAG TPA: hypothetical protein VF109_08405 [Mycobacteriales bacterium]
MTSLLGAPAAVLAAAARAGSTAAALVALPGRALGLVDRIEAAVARVEVLLDAVTVTAARAAEVADAAGLVAAEAGRVARVAGVVAADTRGVVAGAAEVQQEVALLVRAYEPALAALQPTLTRLAETTDPREVDAMVGLVDRLPPLLDAVDTDVLPLLGRLNEMAPDLHALLDAVNDLRRTIAGLPGVGLLRRRGEEEPAEDRFAPDPSREGATRAPTA